MKKTGAFITFIFSIVLLQGQNNLVPNWSFEIDSLCPDTGSEIDYATPWYTAGKSPDYFNACTLYPWVDVPYNGMGYQNAKTGVAYAGMYCYSATTGSIEGEEYLGVKLIDSLIQNRKYCVSFYVTYAKSLLWYNNVAITELGLYISDTLIFSDIHTIPYTPQIQSPPGVYLNDTVNWTEISGTYIAHGGEKYITIGNFNTHTDTIGVLYHNNYSAAYYFIDDVTVRDCTNDGVEEIAEQNISISPNPATNQFTIENSQLRINAIHIYNVLGSAVYQQLTTNNQQLSIDVSTWNTGVYFVEIESEKGIVRKKLVKQ
ncbi:MAG: T9SS type A sorting domain-containing protein [Bacteroidota bacterium]